MASAPRPDASPQAAPEARVVMTKVFVTGLAVQAGIGVYRHEVGRMQPLVVDVELDVPTAGAEKLADTLNYETVLRAAQDIAAQGHIQLVETFAERLARACLADARVTRPHPVEKPLALAPTPSRRRRNQITRLPRLNSPGGTGGSSEGHAKMTDISTARETVDAGPRLCAAIMGFVTEPRLCDLRRCAPHTYRIIHLSSACWPVIIAWVILGLGTP